MTMQKSENFRAGKKTMYTKKSFMQIKSAYLFAGFALSNRYRCTTTSETSCKRIRGTHRQSSERLTNMLERYIKESWHPSSAKRSGTWKVSTSKQPFYKEKSRVVYLQPPSEAQCTEGHVWKLRKCVYGLSDASMKWYECVKSTMTEFQGKMSSVDSALFTWHKGNELLTGFDSCTRRRFLVTTRQCGIPIYNHTKTP